MTIKSNSIKSVLILLLLISLASSIYNIHKLDNQLIEKDAQISEIKKMKSERSLKIDTLVQEIQNEISFTRDGKKISADEIVVYTNELNKEIESLKDSLDYYKTYFKKKKKNNSATYTVKREKNQIKYSLTTKSINTDTVNNLLENTKKIITKLENEKNDISLRLKMYQKAIDKYGIEFKDVVETQNSISYYIVAPKVDSALLIFPVYKNKLKYNTKKNLWEIR
mgnify:CR=1 FL=1